MKVCLEATSLRGLHSGVGVTTRSLARALVDVDPSIDLTLFAMSASRGPGFADAAREPRVRVRGGRPWVRAASWLWWRTDGPPAELFCGNVDVFHGPNYLLPPLRRAAGVLSVHDVAFRRAPQWCSEPVRHLGSVLELVSSRARRILVPSTFTATELAAVVPSVADRVRLVPLAVRDAFRDPPPLGADRARAFGAVDPYVVFLGNLEIRKGVDVLLRAFTGMRRAVPDARLVLVGQPAFGWDQVASAHTELLASGAVNVTGYLPDDVAASLVRGARALVYASRYEGFGLPALEAMAAGTPVIASTAGPLPEVCGPHATYVDPEDDRALAEAMSDMLTSAPDGDRIAAAREYASSFTWTRTARQTIAVYEEAIADR